MTGRHWVSAGVHSSTVCLPTSGSVTSCRRARLSGRGWPTTAISTDRTAFPVDRDRHGYIRDRGTAHPRTARTSCTTSDGPGGTGARHAGRPSRDGIRSNRTIWLDARRVRSRLELLGAVGGCRGREPCGPGNRCLRNLGQGSGKGGIELWRLLFPRTRHRPWRAAALHRRRFQSDRPVESIADPVHVLYLLSPARGRGWVRGLHTSLAPLLSSPPSGGDALE